MEGVMEEGWEAFSIRPRTFDVIVHLRGLGQVNEVLVLGPQPSSFFHPGRGHPWSLGGP